MRTSLPRVTKFEGPITNITLVTGDKFSVPMTRDEVVEKLKAMGPVSKIDDIYGFPKAVNPEHVVLVEQIQPLPGTSP